MTDHSMRHDPPLPPSADEPLEGWLAELASDYHRPPATPREQLWARIQAERGRAVPEAPAVVTVDDLARRRAAGGAGRRWAGPLLALAATLLLGVAIGRWSSWGPQGTPATLASEPAPPRPATLGPAVVMPAPVVPDDAVVPTPAAPVVAPSPERRSTIVEPARPAVVAATPEAGVGAGASDGVAATYRVATIQHLGQVEALLTAFRAEPPRDGAGAAPALEPWARDLLTSTRLLLDSPAAADPRLGPLLGDLETVLVQIVQLPAARAAEERQIIAQSLDEGDLLTQLRTAVPAGLAEPQRSGE